MSLLHSHNSNHFCSSTKMFKKMFLYAREDTNLKKINHAMAHIYKTDQSHDIKTFWADQLCVLSMQKI